MLSRTTRPYARSPSTASQRWYLVTWSKASPCTTRYLRPSAARCSQSFITRMSPSEMPSCSRSASSWLPGTYTTFTLWRARLRIFCTTVFCSALQHTERFIAQKSTMSPTRYRLSHSCSRRKSSRRPAWQARVPRWMSDRKIERSIFIALGERERRASDQRAERRPG
jgi:hypothetical protein